MRLALRLLALAACALSACVMDDDIPPDAVVLCAADSECLSTQRCDLTKHICRDLDADVTAPASLVPTFDPAAATDGTVVVLRLTAEEPLADFAALSFVGGASDPGFVLTPDADTRVVSLVHTVSAADPEGLYLLGSVTVKDASDNELSRSFADVGFKIDRTAPRIEDLSVDDVDSNPAVTLLSDADGTNQARVTFQVSELVATADVVVQIGTLPLACADPVALRFTCTGTIVAGGGVIDGPNPISVSATDGAGNIGRPDAGESANVDLLAPDIVAGTASAEISPNDDFATVGSFVVVRFLVSEPLAATPRVFLDHGGDAEFELEAQSGQFYTMRYRVTADDVAILDGGAAEIHADLTDRFQHSAAGLFVPLGAPFEDGVVIRSTALSPCTIPLTNCSTCTDSDGDGVDGYSAVCTFDNPDEIDCDDNDPLVFPGAIELPGDGKDNDCADDGDMPIDEAHIVFLAEGGDNDNPCSRAFPCKNIGVGNQKGLAEGKVVFLAAGDYSAQGPREINVSFFGGRDRDTWARTGARSATNSLSSSLVPIAMTDIDAVDVLLRGGGVTSNVVARNLAAISPAVIVNTVTTATVNAGISGTRIIGGTHALVVSQAPDLVLINALAGGAHVHPGFGLRILGSTISGSPAVDCQECASVQIYHSHLVGTVGVHVAPRPFTGLTLVGNVIIATDRGIVVDVDGTAPYTIVGNVINSGGFAISYQAINLNVGFLNDCGDPGVCANAFGNIAEPGLILNGAAVDDDSRELVEDRAIDPTPGAPATPLAHRFDAPSSIARDPFGTCRFDHGVAADIGAREFTASP